MTETRELSLEDLYGQFTSDEHVKDSFERRTVPTGAYNFQATKANARELGDNTPWPGRKMITLNGPLSLDGQTKGRLLFDVDYIGTKDTREGRTDKLDQQSQLWGQLVVALDARNKSAGEIMEMTKSYPINIYVVESFKTPEKWETIKMGDEARRAELRKAGYEARNFPRSISRAR